MDAFEFVGQDRFAADNGIRLVSCENGVAVTEVEIAERHLNANRVVQGGLIFTLADTAFALLCNSGERRAVSLADTINFLRPGTGTKLTATARFVSSGKTTSCVDVVVTDDRDRAVAKMQCTGCYI